MHLHLHTGNQLAQCQPIRIERLLAQLGEPNVWLCGNCLDRVLQLCLDLFPVLGTGHSPSCVPLPVRVLDQHLQPDLENEKRKEEKLMLNLLIARACLPGIVQLWVHPGCGCNLLQSLCHTRCSWCTLAVVVLQ